MHAWPSRRTQLRELTRKVDDLMSKQDDIDTAVASLNDSLTTMKAAFAGMAARIDALERAEHVDLTGLNQATTELASAAEQAAAGASKPKPAARKR